jgi:hypothetical protein
MKQFKFATDSGFGTIEADTFEAACRKLDAMVGPSDAGGVGVVEDEDGYRYETTGEDGVEDIGGGFCESADGTVISGN